MKKVLSMITAAVCVWQVSAQDLYWAVGDGVWDTVTPNWTNATGNAVTWTSGNHAWFSPSAPITVTLQSAGVSVNRIYCDYATAGITFKGGAFNYLAGIYPNLATIPLRFESAILSGPTGWLNISSGGMTTFCASNSFTSALGMESRGAGAGVYLSGPAANLGLGSFGNSSGSVRICSEGAHNATRIIPNPIAFTANTTFGLPGVAEDRLVLTGTFNSSASTADFRMTVDIRGAVTAPSRGQWDLLGPGRFFVSGDSSFPAGTITRLQPNMYGMVVMNHPNAFAGSTIRHEYGTLGWGEGVATDISGQLAAATTCYWYYIGTNHISFAEALNKGAGALRVNGDPGGILRLAATTAHTALNAIDIYGGTLLVDMGNMVSPTNALPTTFTSSVQGGTFHIKGKDGADSYQAFPSLTSFGTVRLEAGQGGKLDVVVAGSVGPRLNFELGEDTTLTATGQINTVYPQATLLQSGEYSLPQTDSSGRVVPLATVPFDPGQTAYGLLLTGSATNTPLMTTRNWRSLTVGPLAEDGRLDCGNGLIYIGPILHRGEYDYTIANGTLWPDNSNGILTLFAVGTGSLILDEDCVMTNPIDTPGRSNFAMRKAGKGRLILKNLFKSTSSIELNSGTVEIWRNGSLGFAGDPSVSTVYINGDTTIAAGGDNLTLERPITFPGKEDGAVVHQHRTLTLDVGTGKTLTLSGTIGRSISAGVPFNNRGHLVKQGGGTVILTAASNPFEGKLILKEGTLSVDALAQLGSPTYDALIFRGGTLRVTGTAITSLNSRYTLWDTFDGGIDVADMLNTVTVSSPVTVAEGGMFGKGGAGALILAGGLDLNGQTLAADACPDFQPVTVAGTLDLTGCTVRLTGTPDMVVTLAQAGTVTGTPANFIAPPAYTLAIRGDCVVAKKSGGTVLIIR